MVHYTSSPGAALNLPTEPYLLDASANAAAAARARLRERLDAAFDAAPLDPAAFARGVRAALDAALADAALVTPAQRAGAADTYTRHVLVADPAGRYTVASLVWMPGQHSPVHAHHTWCGYAVIEGTLTETLFAWDEAAGEARAARRRPRDAGALAFARGGRENVHQLGNAGNRRAVSLHVYGVPLDGIATRVNDIVPAASA